MRFMLREKIHDGDEEDALLQSNSRQQEEDIVTGADNWTNFWVGSVVGPSENEREMVHM
jgi:hypothetical protein